MALKLLTAEEMVAISAAWVMADQEGRAALMKIPVLAALAPNLEKTHATLAALLLKASPNISAISQKENEIDAKHDALVRGIYGTLTMLAPVSDDCDELLALRNILLPEGLVHAQFSYRGEAGHVAAVVARLDDALKARLKAIAVHKKTMLDLVLRWADYGTQLGQMEDERARLSTSSPSLAGELHSARIAWMRLAKALMANAKLADIDDETDKLLFSALRTAERLAESRGHSKAPASTPATTVTTTAPGDAITTTTGNAK
jgi:hypothetical protein